MALAEIDDDILEYLKEQASGFGESASTVLRRLLELEDHVPQPEPPAEPPDLPGPPVGLDEGDISISPEDLATAKSAITRMLLILSKLYQAHRSEFDVVREIRGRARVYFSQDQKELLESGKSTYPQPIPNSPWFVTSNLSNDKKRDIIERVLRKLGYSPGDKNRMVALITSANSSTQSIQLRSRKDSADEEDGDAPIQI